VLAPDTNRRIHMFGNSDVLEQSHMKRKKHSAGFVGVLHDTSTHLQADFRWGGGAWEPSSLPAPMEYRLREGENSRPIPDNKEVDEIKSFHNQGELRN